MNVQGTYSSIYLYPASAKSCVCMVSVQEQQDSKVDASQAQSPRGKLLFNAAVQPQHLLTVPLDNPSIHRVA